MIKDIKNEILVRFKQCESILLTGSVLRSEKFNKNSDIDVVLLTSKINHPYTEKVILNNNLYEFIFIPLQNIGDIFKNDILSLNGAFYNMIHSSVVIKDTNNIFYFLKEYSIYLHTHLYPYMDDSEQNRIRIKINNYLASLESNTINYMTRLSLVYEIISLLCSLIINQSGAFIGNAKNKMIILSGLYPDLSIKIENSAHRILEHNENREFIELIKKLLSIKNNYKEYSQKIFPLSIDKNIIVKIEIPIEIILCPYFEGNKNLLEKYKILGYSINNNKLELSLNISTGNKKKHRIIQRIGRIYGIKERDIKRIKITHNYLGNTLNESEKKFHYSFTKYFINRNLFLEDKIIIGIVLLNKFLLHTEKNKKNNLLSFLFKIWLPSSYDSEMIYDFFTLLEKKQDLIKKYRNEYLEILKSYKEKKDKFVDLSNEIYSLLYIPFKDVSISEEYLFQKKFYNEKEKLDIEFFIIEKFLTKVFDMIESSTDKSFYVYFLLKYNKNE